MTTGNVPSFGSLVRRFRRDAGMTADELAAAVGLTWRELNEIERGEGIAPTDEFAARIADALRLAPADRAVLEAAVASTASRSTAPTVPAAAASRSTAPVVTDAPPSPASCAQETPPAASPLAAATPPAAAANRAPHLPIQPTALVGREDAVRQVKALLLGSEGALGARLVTLTGPGGIGKTRLSIEVAAELVGDFADGVYFVRLSRLTDPALVLPTIAQALELHEKGGQPLAQTLRANLADKHVLLVLDNFEQIAPAAPDVAALLESVPGLTVLATSRVPLHLRGEREYPLVPLPLPDPAHLPPPERLSQYAAVALFVARAQDARPDFAVTAANAPAIAEICARLDGLPLAIELAAARVKLLPPEALLARLSSRLKLLTGGARDLEERQQTMRSAVAWSYDLLTGEEQTLFRRLAVFSGGWTLEAAEAICAAPGGAGGGAEPLALDVLDGLGSLVDKSLVQQREEGGEPRFGMLQVIREYALERLEDVGASGGRPEAEALRRAHLTYFLNLGDQFLQAEKATWATVEMQGWFDRIEREHDNFRAALGWARTRAMTLKQCEGAGDPQATRSLEAGIRLVGDLLWFWLSRGHFAEGREWAETLLAMEKTDVPSVSASTSETAEPDHDALRARVRAEEAAGIFAEIQGDTDQAIAALERSLALARIAGDRKGLYYALLNLGGLVWDKGDRERAVALLEESLAIGRELHGPLGGMEALTDLGELTYASGDLDPAAACSEEALSLALQAGTLDMQARNLVVRALIACRRGQLERAAASARKAQELAWATADVRRIPRGLEVCAIVLTAEGQAEGGREERAERAAKLLGAAGAERERVGARRLRLGAGQEDLEAATDKARATLGDERYAAAYAAGRALSREEAYTEALKVSMYSAVLPDVVQNIATRRK